MSPIKLSAKVRGFTFIEMLVSLSIIGVVALIASGFLISSLRTSGKAELNKIIRQNGNYALSVAEGLIINSKKVSCGDPNDPIPSTKEVWITDINDQLSKFICDDAAAFKISSSSGAALPVSVDLTGSNVEARDCTFACVVVSGRPTTVNIKFTVQQKGTTGSPNDQSKIIFETKVVTKNY